MKTCRSLRTMAAGLLLALLLVTSACETRAQEEPRPWYELGLTADPILDQTLLYYLAMTRSRQADIGECLETVARVRPDDPSSWAIEWVRTADRLRTMAQAAEQAGHGVSAGEAYLRSATYYSAALHRHDQPHAPEVKTLTAAAVDCFRRSLPLLGLPATPVAIPYGGTTLPGYFFRSPLAKGPAPTLIVHQGRDGWAEHCKYVADAAIARGYHCLLFDGPGQGQVLRLQGLPFRHDWEAVVGPVVDFVVEQPGVDADRIGLIGFSMGGWLAPRAAAFEKRLKVCVANPGVLSWRDIIVGFLGQFDPALTTLWSSDPSAFDATIDAIRAKVPLVDWGIEDMLWKHGVDRPSALMRELQKYSSEDVVSRIACRTLVMDGTADDFSQGRRLYERLTGPKDYLLFTEGDTGLQHCQVGAQGVSAERLFDWLDGNL